MNHLQLIDGEWAGAVSGATRALVAPATEEIVDELPYGDAEDARRAIDAAHRAFATWAEMNPYERATILERAADLLVERADDYAPVTAEESGKPLSQSRAEWLSAPNYLRYAAEEAKRLGGRWIPSRLPGRRIDVTYRPLGVVGVVTAWNFPVYNPNRATSSALAAGCTVVIRPSSYTPRSAILYAAALHDAGAPPGVVNVINGAADPMSSTMLDDPRVRKMAFTGSSEVGKHLIEGSARTVTRLALELGGNAPVVVFPDVDDLAAVVEAGVTAKLRNCGQVCIAPQRYYVHASIAGEFAELAVAAMERQRLGNPVDPETTVGPLIHAGQRSEVARIVDATVAAGARVATGGAAVDGPGYFYKPTVLTEVPPGSAVTVQEVFGPVLPVIPFDTTEEAVEMANASEFGLASFVFTGDLRTAMLVSDRLEYGLVGVNDWYPVTPEAPFGGTKQSGIGRESGLEGLHEYVEAKARYWGGLG
ncbi:MAG: NAD-dependent succinate-semialdehyde dehydrogenase [Acidimicrobiia bacterium]